MTREPHLVTSFHLPLVLSPRTLEDSVTEVPVHDAPGHVAGTPGHSSPGTAPAPANLSRFISTVLKRSSYRVIGKHNTLLMFDKTVVLKPNNMVDELLCNIHIQIRNYSTPNLTIFFAITNMICGDTLVLLLSFNTTLPMEIRVMTVDTDPEVLDEDKIEIKTKDKKNYLLHDSTEFDPPPLQVSSLLFLCFHEA